MPPAAASAPPGARPRAAALPPEERRAAIAGATVELLVDHRGPVTTRQIAEAAGVAEGTVFRAFPDKEAVLRAAVEVVLDPAPVQARLAAIDRAAPLEARLTAAVATLQEHTTRAWKVLAVVGPAAGRPRAVTALPALQALFEPDADRLRCSPADAAARLRALTVATTHPSLGAAEPLPPAELVSMLLDGIRARPGAAR